MNTKRTWIGSIAGVVSLVGFVTVSAYGSISFDSGNSTSSFFDAINWTNNLLPPFNSTIVDANGFYTTTDPATGNPVSVPTVAEIGNGNNTNVGPFAVIFDPANDVNFNPAGPLATSAPRPTQYGYNNDGSGSPAFVTWRMYLSDGTAANITNSLTINSGKLILRDSGSTNTGPYNFGSSGSAQFLVGRGGVGVLNINGGTLVQEYNGIDLASTVTISGVHFTGNGTLNYYGGTVESGLLIATATATTNTTLGMRLGAADSTGGDIGTNATGTLRVYNNGADGHIRVLNFVVASASSAGGTKNGSIGTVEFHYGVNTHATGGIRPIQTTKNLSINNSATNNQSARLSIVLDSAPTLTAGVPANQGLFDVDADAGTAFDNTIAGTRTGTFVGADGVTSYAEGNTVSAAYGLTQYNWTISYNGKINWSDINNSLVSSVTSGIAGTDKDVVLLGSGVQAAVPLGDINGDHSVNVKDIQALMTALSNLNGYETTNNIVNNTVLDQIADINSDGSVDSRDIQALIAQVANAGGGMGGLSVVPEPGSLVLLTIGGIGLGLAAYRRRKIA